VVELVDLDAVQHAVEVEMPPRTAELAVGRKLEADLFLLLDDVPDFAILDRLELVGADLALFALFACVLKRGWPQEAADMIGAKRRRGPWHRSSLP
jgi:hypothetical protein